MLIKIICLIILIIACTGSISLISNNFKPLGITLVMSGLFGFIYLFTITVDKTANIFEKNTETIASIIISLFTFAISSIEYITIIAALIFIVLLFYKLLAKDN